MANSNPTSGGASGNPGIVDIEATNVSVRADDALNAVMVEVSDQTGAGFRCLLDPNQGMRAAIQIGAAVARLWHLPGAAP